jgi:hypothetical protein
MGKISRASQERRAGGAGRIRRKDIEREQLIRREQARAEKALEGIQFYQQARGLVATYNFDRLTSKQSREKARAMVRREMSVVLLRHGKKIGQLNEFGESALFLLDRASKIELRLWEKRKGEFTASQAFKMYRAASQLERRLSPGLPKGKVQLATDVRESLGSKLEELRRLKDKSPDARVKVRASLLAIIAREAVRRANSLRKQVGPFAHIGSIRIQKAALKALPARKP